MKISFVGIQNFRKLKSTKIEFSNKTTVFVGANNSGKTTAIVALKKFLKIKKLTLNDFTISNQSIINKIGKNYIENGETSEVDITLWQSILPSLDLWLDIEDNELYYVPELIPNLQWEGPKVGVRFVYEPVNLNSFLILYSSYYLKVNRNKKLKELNLWPSNLCDFLDKKIESTFEMHSYIFVYRKIQASENDVYNPEILDEGVEPLPFEPLKKIIKLDIISAQRGLDDTDTKEKSTNTSYNLLSNQLRNYYDSQLDIKQELSDSDIETLKDLHSAEATFSKQIASKFQKPMEELAEFGYPGKYNPEIIIEAKASTEDILTYGTTVRYPLYNEELEQYKLPENYNGLGYQNLISISFKLMKFRDSWINNKLNDVNNDELSIAPIHLVLIEEPEAHLHTQVQRVFVENAYKILTNSKKISENFSTQLLLTTHSNNIALAIEFEDLRYFKRIESDKGLPISIVINLSEIFGPKNDTSKFAIRYLKATHCDLFFADALILVEGAAERILVPHFIKNKYPKLNQSYISILEIGGRHSHRLKPLIDKLGIITLIITDIDIVNKETKKSEKFQISENQITTNTTLNEWIPKKKSIADLTNLPFEKKEFKLGNGLVRVAYQIPVDVVVKRKEKSQEEEKFNFIPSTFEDSLIYTNFNIFKDLTEKGVIKKINQALKKTRQEEIENDIYELINGKVNKSPTMKKAEFALDLLYINDPKDFITPNYIAEGLDWLQSSLKGNEKPDFLNKSEKKNE